MEGGDGGGRRDDGLDESQASYGKDQLGYNNTEEEDRDQDTQGMADGEGHTGAKVCAVAPHHSSGPVVVSTAVPAPPSVGPRSNATPVPYSLDRHHAELDPHREVSALGTPRQTHTFHVNCRHSSPVLHELHYKLTEI